MHILDEFKECPECGELLDGDADVCEDCESYYAYIGGDEE
jgi:RNA polymerase subunit RPABC4/transcription elongation factor Spt4